MTADVLIVEDHQLLAQALAAALRGEGVDALVADCTHEVEVLAHVTPGMLVLLDLQLADGQDGSELVAPLCRAGARVLVVTGSRNLPAIGRALDAGALHVLNKEVAFGALLDAIAAVLAGAAPGDPAARQSLLRAAHACMAERESAAAVLDRLTPRETAVLDELCRGVGVEEVATRSHVSLTTVRTQVRSVLSKLGVHTQLAAVARARTLRSTVAGRLWTAHPG